MVRCSTGLDMEGKRKKSGRIPGQIPGSLVDPCVKGKLDLGYILLAKLMISLLW